MMTQFTDASPSLNELTTNIVGVFVEFATLVVYSVVLEGCGPILWQYTRGIKDNIQLLTQTLH